MNKRAVPGKDPYLDLMMEIADVTMYNIDEIMKTKKGQVTSRDVTIDALLNYNGAVPKGRSSLMDMRCCTDLKLFNQFGFKCGWVKGMQHVTVRNEFYIGRSSSSFIDICESTAGANLDYESIIELLEITLNESTFNNQTFEIEKGDNFLKRQNNFYKQKASRSNNYSFKYRNSVWQLCQALWRPLDKNKLRRDHLSDWLKSTLYHLVVDDYDLKYPACTNGIVLGTLFYLLSLNQVYEAAQYALINNLPQLSLLISQLNTSNDCRCFLQEQIIFWYNTGIQAYIPETLKKIFLLISGNAQFQDINICKDLDWKRSFGFHLWFVVPPNASIHECVSVYKNSFDNKEAYAVAPVPPYQKDNYQVRAHDILYHLIFLYCSDTYLLNHVLNPSTYTPDSADYSLSWFLLQFFHSLDIGVITDSCELMITLSFVLQLENSGHWKWAIFVAMFIRDTSLKKKHIMGILQRNFDTEGEKSLKRLKNTERFLVHKLRVPVEWIHEFRASKAIFYDDQWKAFANFCYLKDYFQGNDIFVDTILPNLFLSEHYKELDLALIPFHDMTYKINTWKNEIGLILSYIELQKWCQDSPEMNLPKIHGGMLEILNNINSFPTRNSIQKLCVAELSKKCVKLQRLLMELVNDEDSKCIFLRVIQKLLMPPDYIYTECSYFLRNMLENYSHQLLH